MLLHSTKEIIALGLLPVDAVSLILAEGLLDAIAAYFRELSQKEHLAYGRRLIDVTHVSIPRSVNLPGHPHRISANPQTVYFVPGPASLDLNLRIDVSRKCFHLGEVSVSGGGVGLKAKTAAEFGIQSVFLALGESCFEADVFQAWACSIGGVTFVEEGPARVVPHISVHLEDGRVLGPVLLVPELELTEQEGYSLIELVRQKLPDVRDDPNQHFFVVNGRHTFPGLNPHYYRDLIQLAKDKGFLPVVDFRIKMSVEEMEALYRSGPWMATPNLSEFEKFLQKDFEESLDLQHADVERILQLAYTVAEQYCITLLIVTLGERGLVAVFRNGNTNPQGVYVPVPHYVDVVSTVGAGDAVAGAFLGKWLSTECDFISSLVTAVAAGTATITLEGSEVASRELIDSYISEVEKGDIRQFQLPIFPDVLVARGYDFMKSFARGGSSMGTFLAKSSSGNLVVVKHSDWQGVTGDGTPWLLGQAEKLKAIHKGTLFPDKTKKLYPQVLDVVQISRNEGFYAMEYFENTEDLAQYYLNQTHLTGQEMLDDLSQILTMMVETHYKHHAEKFEREIKDNWVKRPGNRVALLDKRDNEIYEKLVRGNSFSLGSLNFDDASYFFEDLISKESIVIQGEIYLNLPVLIRILERNSDLVEERLGSTHWSPLVHGDLSIRNFLKLPRQSSNPEDSFRIMDVRAPNKVNEVTPTKTSIEYDLAKLAYSPFMEIVRNGFYEVKFDEKNTRQEEELFAFTTHYIVSPGSTRYRECRNSFYNMLRENQALGKLMSEIPNQWEDYVRLGECMNYASDAVHRYSQDSSGMHSLAYYLEATVGLHTWLSKHKLLPEGNS